MLVIAYVTEKHPNAPLKTKEWNVDEELPTFSFNFLWGVQSVTVDGTEKTYVLDHFKNLPVAIVKPTTVWIGEFAKFVVSNFCTLE